MRAGDERLGTVFNKDHRYIVPIFQRPYVWDEEENWIPLWDDLRKATEEVERQADTGDDDAQEYFLGALVTQHRPPMPRRIPTSMVIDGQQRMTTFQVFLAAARRVAIEFDATHAAASFEALVRNRVSADSDHSEDRFKLAPLDHDRESFEWAVRGHDDVSEPAVRSHKLIRAANWFEATIRDWVKEAASPSDRLDLLHFAVENRIKVVSIFLDAKDDPQVIFEALNHRGVRLDAADLVKNLLFQTLDRQGDHHLERELLHDHWGILDSGSWREEVTTGRVKRVRVDVLLAYWLSAQRGEESSVEHLFEDFKRWLKSSIARAAEVIKDIRVYADTMDRLQRLPMTSPVAQVIDRLDATNTTTPWPLLLFLHASAEIPEKQAVKGTQAVDSYLMRRAVCRMTTKDYNRLFGGLLGAIKEGDIRSSGDLLVAGLISQTADSRLWPDDRAFMSGLLSNNLFNELVRARLRTLLVGLENHLITAKSEPTTPHKAASKAFTIEHVMPVKWQENWPLPVDASDEDMNKRVGAIHSLGNLTLATQSLNSTLSNQPWIKKRHTLQAQSLARLTTGSILTYPQGVNEWTQDDWVSDWDENRIALRGLWLVSAALHAWPRPDQSHFDLGLASLNFVEPPDPGLTRTGSESRSRIDHAVHGDLLPLITGGLVVPGDRLHHHKVRTGEVFHATVTVTGGLDTSAGIFRAPSPALSKLVRSSRNGWTDWTHVQTGKTLAELREMLPGRPGGE